MTRHKINIQKPIPVSYKHKHVCEFLFVLKWRALFHNFTNTFSQGNDGVRVNSVQVPKSDLMASNGVIHISKSLLYPEGVEYNTPCYIIVNTIAFKNKQGLQQLSILDGFHLKTFFILLLFFFYRCSCWKPGIPLTAQKVHQVHPDQGTDIYAIKIKTCMHPYMEISCTAIAIYEVRNKTFQACAVIGK